MRDLPKYVYHKHGAYYFVRDNKWTRLCSDREQVDLHLAAATVVPQGKEVIYKYALRALAKARANAKCRRRVGFDLTKENLISMLNACAWKCAVTNTPFSIDTVGSNERRPFAPSIDRIDSSGGYTPDNCRIVCVAANLAMNTWGAGVLLELARNAVRTAEF